MIGKCIGSLRKMRYDDVEESVCAHTVGGSMDLLLSSPTVYVHTDSMFTSAL